MIADSGFTVDEWNICEQRLSPDRLAQTESIFALGNGHIGLRGNLDEGEPHGLPGTYLNGFYESRPLPYAEAGYGYPEAGQTVVNVTNGKLIRLLVDDEPLDVRYGQLIDHERVLDMRAGVLRRRVEWRSPGHRAIRIRTTRMVSLVQRAMIGIEYQVEVLDAPARIVLQSELIANEQLPVRSADPMAAETGHLDLAYDYWGEAALMDLDDLEHNTGDGLHIASLAGSWMVAVCGFGGLRDTGGALSFRPRLPGALHHLTFNLTWRGSHLNVAVADHETSYTCHGDGHIDLLHYGESVRVEPGATEIRAIPLATACPRPRQPPGREPANRGLIKAASFEKEQPSTNNGSQPGLTLIDTPDVRKRSLV